MLKSVSDLLETSNLKKKLLIFLNKNRNAILKKKKKHQFLLFKKTFISNYINFDISLNFIPSACAGGSRSPVYIYLYIIYILIITEAKRELGRLMGG